MKYRHLDLYRARVAEAVQLLEQTGLVYVLWISEATGRGRHWKATQLGLAALANGDYRQRIQDRTGAVTAPGPAPAAVTLPRASVAQRLQELETLRAAGALSDAEYTSKLQQIMADI